MVLLRVRGGWLTTRFLIALGDRLRVVALSIDVPTWSELRSRLDHVPCLPEELAEERLGKLLIHEELPIGYRLRVGNSRGHGIDLGDHGSRGSNG